MVRSMVAGVAGLKAHQSKMDVIGNNIANVNTWGFKGFSYNFKDAMYTNSITSTGGSVEAGAAGGRNASQVGYGSQLSSISNLFENGAPSPSSDPMDCMIDGTGFFLVGNMVNGSFTNVADAGLYLSRVGIFRVDDNKFLVDDQKSYVYGYQLIDGTGVPETPAVAASTTMKGVPYELDLANGTITIAGVKVQTSNISGKTEEEARKDPRKAIEDWVDRALTDETFAGYKIEYNGMNSVVTTPADPEAGVNEVRTNLPSFTITSTSTGSATTDRVAEKVAIFRNNGETTSTQDPPPGFDDSKKTLGVDYVASVQAEYSEELSTLRIPIDPNTGQRYKLSNYSINENGIIAGVDENNRTIVIGQLALIQVQNPNGLEKTDGYYYQIGDNAGDVDHVKPNTGPAGVIMPGYLEMANVDLANEFSNIITTQRGFQANSKIITVTDEMLQELVNMKR